MHVNELTLIKFMIKKAKSQIILSFFLNLLFNNKKSILGKKIRKTLHKF